MNKGAYQLVISIDKDIEIRIGALGLQKFEAGIYIYTGSAMKNLDLRVARHYRKDKQIRWHIDYLLADLNVRIIEHKMFPSEYKTECKINQKTMKQKGTWVPVKKFGSSDCKVCSAHLIGIKKFSKERNG